MFPIQEAEGHPAKMPKRSDVPIQEAAKMPKRSDVPIQEAAKMQRFDVPIQEAAKMPRSDVPIQEAAIFEEVVIVRPPVKFGSSL
jgi:hypothetical protein